MKRHQKGRCKGIQPSICERLKEEEVYPKNPQVSAIANAIINNGITVTPESRKRKLSTPLDVIPTKKMAPAVKKKRKRKLELHSDVVPAKRMLFPPSPSKTPSPPPWKNIKFLPPTVEGLANRFNDLFLKYWNEKQYQYHNELVYLVDELLKQDGITQDTYKKVNGLLSCFNDMISLSRGGDGIDDDDDDDDDDNDDDEEKEEEEEEEQQQDNDEKVKSVIRWSI